ATKNTAPWICGQLGLPSCPQAPPGSTMMDSRSQIPHGMTKGPFWLPQNPVSGLGQEHCTIEDLVWLDQFVSVAQKIDATHAAELHPRGVVCPKFANKAKSKLNQA
ncbi:MAG: hypothetical protein KGZ76_06300, partial [Dethiobacter sp.]|nr:hypothetical protein [Dethiobacter sp.]